MDKKEFQELKFRALLKRDINIYADFLNKYRGSGFLDKEYVIDYNLAKPIKKRAIIEHTILEEESMAFYDKVFANKWLLQFEKGYKGWKK